jgi:hypothetical protein
MDCQWQDTGEKYKVGGASIDMKMRQLIQEALTGDRHAREEGFSTVNLSFIVREFHYMTLRSRPSEFPPANPAQWPRNCDGRSLIS